MNCAIRSSKDQKFQKYCTAIRTLRIISSLCIIVTMQNSSKILVTFTNNTVDKILSLSLSPSFGRHLDFITFFSTSRRITKKRLFDISTLQILRQRNAHSCVHTVVRVVPFFNITLYGRSIWRYRRIYRSVSYDLFVIYWIFSFFSNCFASN